LIGRTPWSSRVCTKVEIDPGWVSRLVNAVPLSDNTIAGAPWAVNACLIAVTAPAAVSAGAAWQASRVRVQSSRTSKTATAVPSPSFTSVASIW
jgi:hypothetical protein